MKRIFLKTIDFKKNQQVLTPNKAEKPMAKKPQEKPFEKDIKEAKDLYREQTDNWNRHLDGSRREADDRLQKILDKYKK